MIRKSGYRFSEKIMLKQKIERDDDSKKSHHALERFRAKVCPGLDPGWYRFAGRKRVRARGASLRSDSIGTEKALAASPSAARVRSIRPGIAAGMGGGEADARTFD